MGVTVIPKFAHTQAEQSGQVEIYVDNAEAIAGLGTDYTPGSRAYVMTAGLPTYMLNNAKEWVSVDTAP